MQSSRQPPDAVVSHSLLINAISFLLPKLRLLLRELVAVRFELFSECFELAAARRICVALTAWQFGLGREFRFCIRRCRDKGGSRAQQCYCANSARYAACCSANTIGRAAEFRVKHEHPPLFGTKRLTLSP
jgi:hypothetical protein